MIEDAGDVAMLLADLNHLEPAEVAVELAASFRNADCEPARLVVHDQSVDVGPVGLRPFVVDGIAVVVAPDAPSTDHRRRRSSTEQRYTELIRARSAQSCGRPQRVRRGVDVDEAAWRGPARCPAVSS